MKYEVIARRYRPRKFEEVVGQEAVAQTLRGGIEQERLAHAYLFAGPRGVGKTSMARIFAKAINCPEAANRERDRSEWGRPCDDCPVCRAIHSGQDIDVIEMDGASHRGIEDIRGLIEGVNRPASRGVYKVYLIDEVHMLTREAFNALLKTIEEPPPHVKFIFATTEVHKIPDTVLSRCQRFDFQPIETDAIVRRLAQICEGEGRKWEEGLLEQIASCSQGGLRDSQTLLDQLMTYCEGETDLDSEAFDRLTGRVATSRLDELVAGLIDRDSSRVLVAVRACFAVGADPSILLEQVIESLHEKLRDAVVGAAGDDAGRVDVLIGCLQILLRTAADLRASAYPNVAVEVALLKLSRLEDPRALDRALERLSMTSPAAGGPVAEGPSSREAFANPSRSGELPPVRPPVSTAGDEPVEPQTEWTATGGVASGPTRGTAVADSEPVAATAGGPALATEMGSPQEVGPAAGHCFDGERLEALWEQILIEIREQHAGVASFIAGAGIETGASDSVSVILDNDFFHAQLNTPRRLEILRRVVAEVTGVPWNVSVELRPGGLRRVATAPSEGVAVTPSEGVAVTPSEGVAVTPSEGVAGQRSADTPAVSDHPVVKKSLELFNGRLV